MRRFNKQQQYTGPIYSLLFCCCCRSVQVILANDCEWNKWISLQLTVYLCEKIWRSCRLDDDETVRGCCSYGGCACLPPCCDVHHYHCCHSSPDVNHCSYCYYFDHFHFLPRDSVLQVLRWEQVEREDRRRSPLQPSPGGCCALQPQTTADWRHWRGSSETTRAVFWTDAHRLQQKDRKKWVDQLMWQCGQQVPTTKPCRWLTWSIGAARWKAAPLCGGHRSRRLQRPLVDLRLGRQSPLWRTGQWTAQWAAVSTDVHQGVANGARVQLKGVGKGAKVRILLGARKRPALVHQTWFGGERERDQVKFSFYLKPTFSILMQCVSVSVLKTMRSEQCVCVCKKLSKVNKNKLNKAKNWNYLLHACNASSILVFCLFKSFSPLFSACIDLRFLLMLAKSNNNRNSSSSSSSSKKVLWVEHFFCHSI